MRSALSGLAALSALEPLEEALLGGAPVYHPARMTVRWIPALARRARLRGAAAATLRTVYALAVARTLRAARPWLPRSRVLAGVSAGLALAAAELVLLPATRATPVLGRWRPRELPLLALHATVFCLAALDH
jgi:hypothetical protein